MSFLCCFFFQAEDGIRDKLVTGVQTCALPISGSGTEDDEILGCLVRRLVPRDHARIEPEGTQLVGEHRGEVVARVDHERPRSEERRVGKECRSRWSPDAYKKQKEATHARRAGR